MDTLLPIIAIVLSIIITALLGKVFIPWLRKLKFGQTILEIGPKWHKGKQGTPTMGGFMFIIGILVSVAVALTVGLVSGDNNLFSELIPAGAPNKLKIVRLVAGLLLAIMTGAVGFFDDYIKVVKKRNLGLTAKQKTMLQLLIAAAYLATLALAGDHTTSIPFVNVEISTVSGIGLIYWPISLIFIYGFTNAVNLTDGVDGLASSVTMVVSAIYMCICTILHCYGFSIVAAAVAGGCIGFLFWNLHPAKVFMGDTGSMFLGGIVVAIAFGSGYPILLFLCGIVYLLEAMSVVIQVAYYKKTGKRLFKMSPIHHHFELSSWSENKIVLVFSCVAAVGGLIAFLLVKLGA